MLRILHDTKFDFIKWWRWAAGLTAAFILLGLASFAIRGSVNYSIEFTGGTLMQIQFAKSADAGKIRETLDQAGISGAEIQKFGSDSEFTIRAQDKRELPTVGDWVLVDRWAEAIAEHGAGVIRHVLPRKSLLVRKAAGGATLPQPVAANVDCGIVMTSANKDLSPKRLDRYVMLLRDGGITPVLVLSKVDLRLALNGASPKAADGPVAAQASDPPPPAAAAFDWFAWIPTVGLCLALAACGGAWRFVRRERRIQALEAQPAEPAPDGRQGHRAIGLRRRCSSHPIGNGRSRCRAASGSAPPACRRRTQTQASRQLFGLARAAPCQRRLPGTLVCARGFTSGTLAELATVQGVGAAKLARYGEAMLAAVAAEEEKLSGEAA